MVVIAGRLQSELMVGSVVGQRFSARCAAACVVASANNKTSSNFFVILEKDVDCRRCLFIVYYCCRVYLFVFLFYERR